MIVRVREDLGELVSEVRVLFLHVKNTLVPRRVVGEHRQEVAEFHAPFFWKQELVLENSVGITVRCHSHSYITVTNLISEIQSFIVLL